MTLQQLTYLAAIHDHFGVNEAAKACGVAQPTVTIQVKKLEKELKAKLVNRDAYPAQLTELGDLVARQAKIIFKDVALIQDIIKAYSKGELIQIGSPKITTNKELRAKLKNQKKDIKALSSDLKAMNEQLSAITEKADKIV